MAENFTDLAGEIVAEVEYEFETNLIEAVKGHPCLYDTENADYENMEQNKNAWIAISGLLKKTVTECMNKWYALLQIFMHYLGLERSNFPASQPIVWPHYKAIKEIQPNLADHFSQLIQMKPPFIYAKPSNTQRAVLCYELELNRDLLFGAQTTIQQRQQFWARTAEKLNSMNGAHLPVIRWQKCWWDMKQAVGLHRSWIQMKLKSMGTQIEVSKFSSEDERILKFFGATTSDTLASINAKLSSNVEFGCDADKILRKCKKCDLILNEVTLHDYCETCRKIPKTLCDICSKHHEKNIQVLQLKNWSTHAKNLLPPSFLSHVEISICATCLLELRKQASVVWMACRICESHAKPLENLFSNANFALRSIFEKATSFELNEQDGLPRYICTTCKVQLQQFNNFYMKYCRTTVRLRKIQLENVVGFNIGVQSGANKPVSSIVSENQVMILQPGVDTSNGNISSAEQNNTLQPGALATSNMATTMTTPSPATIIKNHVFPKSTVIKRICSCKGDPEKEVSTSMTTSTGTIVSRRIGTLPTTATKSNGAGQPGAILVGKGVCALHQGTVASPQTNTNRACQPVMTLTSKENSEILPGTVSSIPNSATIQQNRNVQPVASTQSTANIGLVKRNIAGTKKRTIIPAHVPEIPTTTATKETSVLPQETAPNSKKSATIKGSSINSVAANNNSSCPTAPPPGSTQYYIKKSNFTLPPELASASPSSENTGTIIGKRFQVTQPAVFTIPGMDLDYETQIDSPKAFCISKLNPQSKPPNDKPNSKPTAKASNCTPKPNPQSKVQNNKTNSNPIGVSSTCMPQSKPPLKTTTKDKTNSKLIAMFSTCVPQSTPQLKATNESTFSIPKKAPSSTTLLSVIKTEKVDNSYPGEATQSGNPICNGTKQSVTVEHNSEVSLNASTISVESASVHTDNTAKRMRLIRLDGSTVVYNSSPQSSPNVKSNQQQAVPSFQNTFTAAKFNLIQPRKPPRGRPNPSNPQSDYPGRITQTGPVPTGEPQRQCQQQQPTSVNKKARKYWGAVDEFQITPLTSKTTFNDPALKKRRRMTIHNLSSTRSLLTESSPVPANNSLTTTPIPFGENTGDVQVKKEDEQPTMFYPDSFELASVSLGADVSSILCSMINKDEEIDDNMKSFEYINPSFLMSYVKDQNLSQQTDKSQRENPKTVESKKEKLLKAAEKKDEHEKKKNSKNLKLKIKMPIRKLRVKLKRDIRLNKSARRLKTPSPTPLVITKRSLRKSRSNNINYKQ